MRRMIEVKEYADGSAVINDGLSVNKNGDVEVGRNLKVDGVIEQNDIVFGVATILESLVSAGSGTREATEEEIEWIHKHYNYSHFNYNGTIYPNQNFYKANDNYHFMIAQLAVNNNHELDYITQVEISLDGSNLSVTIIMLQEITL